MAREPLEKMLEENIDLPGVEDKARRQAVFLSLWDEILEQYTKGWCYKHIWQALHRRGVIDFGYPTFLSYIRKMKRRINKVRREGVPGVKEQSERKDGSKADLSLLTPKSNRVDMPEFGERAKGLDPKRF